MSKKAFAVIGMIVCVLFVVMGFATMRQDNACSTAYSSGIYDSGYGTFGADYYTYSNNNAAEAASAARTTANNLYKLYDLLTNVFGWLFVFAGVIGFCQFGIILAECKNVAPIAPEKSAGLDLVEEISENQQLLQ